jgi:hypothetical protein
MGLFADVRLSVPIGACGWQGWRRNRADARLGNRLHFRRACWSFGGRVGDWQLAEVRRAAADRTRGDGPPAEPGICH